MSYRWSVGVIEGFYKGLRFRFLFGSTDWILHLWLEAFGFGFAFKIQGLGVQGKTSGLGMLRERSHGGWGW